MALNLQDPIEPKTNWKMFFWIFIIARSVFYFVNNDGMGNLLNTK